MINNSDNNSTISNTSLVVKKSNRFVYFKALFINKRDEYMGVLYDQEIIDHYINHADVAKKIKQVDKDKKN